MSSNVTFIASSKDEICPPFSRINLRKRIDQIFVKN